MVRDNPSWKTLISPSPGGFPKYFSPCSKILVFYYHQLLVHLLKQRATLLMVFYNILLRCNEVFLPLHLLLLSNGNAAHRSSSSLPCLHPLSPSLCGWLLISKEGQHLRSFLQKPFFDHPSNLVPHYHQFLTNEKETISSSTIRSQPCFRS